MNKCEPLKEKNCRWCGTFNPDSKYCSDKCEKLHEKDKKYWRDNPTSGDIAQKTTVSWC